MSEHEPQVADDLAPAEAEDVQPRDVAVEGGHEPEPDTDVKLVPVSESIRYRKRAQAAEQQLDELKQQCRSLQQSLDEATQQVTQSERRRQIDQMLVESEAIDLEAARLLTEAAIEQMDDADVQLAVSELRRRRPYLFRSAASQHPGGSMSPKPRRGGHQLSDAAETASVSGDRRDLLRYLRMRRTQPS